MVKKVDKVLQENLVKMASRAMTELVDLLVNQACQGLREETEHPDEQESVETEEQLEVAELPERSGVLEFLELWAQLVRKVISDSLEIRAKRVSKESKVTLEYEERPGTWELRVWLEQRALRAHLELLVTEVRLEQPVDLAVRVHRGHQVLLVCPDNPVYQESRARLALAVNQEHQAYQEDRDYQDVMDY